MNFTISSVSYVYCHDWRINFDQFYYYCYYIINTISLQKEDDYYRYYRSFNRESIK